MKIGIDMRTVANHKDGKGRYVFNLVKELTAIGGNDFVLYTNDITKDFAQFRNSHIKVVHKHPLLWHNAVIKDWIHEDGDLFFAPTSYIIPALLPKQYKSIITVHDLVAFLHPRIHQTKATLIERLFLKRALNKTQAVLTPSENTKHDLVKLFHYPKEKIHITPLAADEIFFKEIDKKHLEEVQTKYHLPHDFILAVSGLEPRKNLGVLIDALPQDTKLVIVGGKGWKSKKTRQKISAHSNKIIHIEGCNTDDLAALYKLAKVFVFPSLYEGFGLPPLEAMASGCPVICSNSSSLPEVVESAALLFDPTKPQELTSHLKKILENPARAQELAKRGKEQAARFSWKNTAEKTLEAFTLKNGQ